MLHDRVAACHEDEILRSIFFQERHRVGIEEPTKIVHGSEIVDRKEKRTLEFGIVSFGIEERAIEVQEQRHKRRSDASASASFALSWRMRERGTGSSGTGGTIDTETKGSLRTRTSVFMSSLMGRSPSCS